MKGSITSPEALIMIPLAILFDLIMLIIGIIELCVLDVDLGLVSAIVGWIGWFVFGAWVWLRSDTYNAIERQQEETKGKEDGDKNKNESAQTGAEEAENSANSVNGDKKSPAEAIRDSSSNTTGAMQITPQGKVIPETNNKGASGNKTTAKLPAKEFDTEWVRNPRAMIDKQIQKLKDKVKDEIKKAVVGLIKRLGWSFLLKGIPFISWIYPGFTDLVIREITGWKLSSFLFGKKSDEKDKGGTKESSQKPSGSAKSTPKK